MTLIRAGTHRWVPGDVTEASETFAHLLLPEQLAVAREIVETRAPELARAYPGIIDISFGYRRRRNRRTRRLDIVKAPCVRFIVRHKWPRREKHKHERIPSRLFAYWTIDGRRRLCAVPTDVESASSFTSPHAQAEPIRAHWKTSTADGAIACALTRDSQPATTFALSCRHVLSLTDLYCHEPTWGAAVTVKPDVLVGPTVAVAGQLQNPPDRSFDAQLLESVNNSALGEALGGLTLSGYAKGYDDLPDEWFIRTPSLTIAARKLGFVYDRPYYVGCVGTVVHYLLVESTVDTPTEGGHSGSPVVSAPDGGVFLGMHVAGMDNGPGNRFAYMIPAWQLFDPSNYDGAANSEIWTPAQQLATGLVS